MKIAVLNECFLSSGNLADLKSLGEVEVFDNTTDEATAIKRMASQDIILADMFECPLNANVLGHAASVKLLCVNSTGFDLVALDAATANNIKIANTPGFSTEAVAEHTFALLMAVNRRIVESAAAVSARPFQINPGDQTHYAYLGTTLAGKTFGIIGMGAIGSHAAKIAHGFGMRIIAHSRSDKITSDVEFVSLAELAARADIISLHTPLNEKSAKLIDAKLIAKMNTGVILLNTARGGCIVSEDLALALRQNRIAGAGLDDIDPWTPDNPLLTAPHTVITPHLAWFTQEALGNIGDIMTGNVKAYVEGCPRNIISA